MWGEGAGLIFFFFFSFEMFKYCTRILCYDWGYIINVVYSPFETSCRGWCQTAHIEWAFRSRRMDSWVRNQCRLRRLSAVWRPNVDVSCQQWCRTSVLDVDVSVWFVLGEEEWRQEREMSWQLVLILATILTPSKTSWQDDTTSRREGEGVVRVESRKKEDRKEERKEEKVEYKA